MTNYSSFSLRHSGHSDPWRIFLSFLTHLPSSAPHLIRNHRHLSSAQPPKHHKQQLWLILVIVLLIPLRHFPPNVHLLSTLFSVILHSLSIHSPTNFHSRLTYFPLTLHSMFTLFSLTLHSFLNPSPVDSHPLSTHSPLILLSLLFHFPILSAHFRSHSQHINDIVNTSDRKAE